MQVVLRDDGEPRDGTRWRAVGATEKFALKGSMHFLNFNWHARHPRHVADRLVFLRANRHEHIEVRTGLLVRHPKTECALISVAMRHRDDPWTQIVVEQDLRVDASVLIEDPHQITVVQPTRCRIYL